MGDFLAELFDQFDPEEQARIRAAEDATRGILAQGAAAVRDRQLAAGSAVLTDWVLEPEDDARADAAGVVFAAYVNALWRQTDPARSEWIQEFGAKVDKLVDPVLTRYGREGEGMIAKLRWKCQMNVSLVHSALQTSTASAMSSTTDSTSGSPRSGTDHASRHTEAADIAAQPETERGQSSGAEVPAISVPPWEILGFFESWGRRRRTYSDLNAEATRRRRNWHDAERVEKLLTSARGWAEPVLRELVSEVQDVFELKQRVAKQAFDKYIKDGSYFWERYQEFESALWEERCPSLQDHAIRAMAERATSAASQAEAVVTGSLAEGRGVDPARLAGIPLQAPAEETMTDLPKLPSAAQAHLDGAKRIAQETLGHARIHLKRAAETKRRLEALGVAGSESAERVELQGQYERHLENAQRSVQLAIGEMFDAYAAKHWQAVCPDAATFSGRLPAIAAEVESSLTCPELASTIAEALTHKRIEWADKTAREQAATAGRLEHVTELLPIVAEFRRQYARSPGKKTDLLEKLAADLVALHLERMLPMVTNLIEYGQFEDKIYWAKAFIDQAIKFLDDEDRKVARNFVEAKCELLLAEAARDLADKGAPKPEAGGRGNRARGSATPPEICFDRWGEIPRDDPLAMSPVRQRGFYLVNDGGAAHEITVESFEIGPSTRARSKMLARIEANGKGFALVWLEDYPPSSCRDKWDLLGAMHKASLGTHGHPMDMQDYSVTVSVVYRDAAEIWYRSSAEMKFIRSRLSIEFGSTTHRTFVSSSQEIAGEQKAQPGGRATENAIVEAETEHARVANSGSAEVMKESRAMTKPIKPSLWRRDQDVHEAVGEKNFKSLTNTEIMHDRNIGKHIKNKFSLKAGAENTKACLDRIRRAKGYPLSREITNKRSTQK
jgi:hypothetical protein